MNIRDKIFSMRMQKREFERTLNTVNRFEDDEHSVRDAIREILGKTVEDSFFIVRFTPIGVLLYSSHNGRFILQNIQNSDSGYFFNWAQVKQKLPKLMTLALSYKKTLTDIMSVSERIEFFEGISDEEEP